MSEQPISEPASPHTASQLHITSQATEGAGGPASTAPGSHYDEAALPQWEQSLRPTHEPTPNGTGKATLIILGVIVLVAVLLLVVVKAMG